MTKAYNSDTTVKAHKRSYHRHEGIIELNEIHIPSNWGCQFLHNAKTGWSHGKHIWVKLVYEL